jgi:hypothetical protein
MKPPPWRWLLLNLAKIPFGGALSGGLFELDTLALGDALAIAPVAIKPTHAVKMDFQ